MSKIALMIILFGVAGVGISGLKPDSVHHSSHRISDGRIVEKTWRESPFDRYIPRQRALYEERFSKDIQGYWELVELKDSPSDEALGVHLDIHRGGRQKLCSVGTTCNSCGGKLNVKDSQSSFAGFSCTKMGCGERGKWEHYYVGLLSTSRSYEISDGNLDFFNDQGERIARYQRYKDGFPEYSSPQGKGSSPPAFKSSPLMKSSHDK